MMMESIMWEPDSVPAMFCLVAEIAAAERGSHIPDYKPRTDGIGYA